MWQVLVIFTMSFVFYKVFKEYQIKKDDIVDVEYSAPNKVRYETTAWAEILNQKLYT